MPRLSVQAVISSILFVMFGAKPLKIILGDLAENSRLRHWVPVLLETCPPISSFLFPSIFNPFGLASRYVRSTTVFLQLSSISTRHRVFPSNRFVYEIPPL